MYTLLTRYMQKFISWSAIENTAIENKTKENFIVFVLYMTM